MAEIRGDRRWRPEGLKGSVQEDSVARITILGAGFMGSALTFPASDNGHRVALWGTWLDEGLDDHLDRAPAWMVWSSAVSSDPSFGSCVAATS